MLFVAYSFDTLSHIRLLLIVLSTINLQKNSKRFQLCLPVIYFRINLFYSFQNILVFICLLYFVLFSS